VKHSQFRLGRGLFLIDFAVNVAIFIYIEEYQFSLYPIKLLINRTKKTKSIQKNTHVPKWQMGIKHCIYWLCAKTQ